MKVNALGAVAALPSAVPPQRPAVGGFGVLLDKLRAYDLQLPASRSPQSAIPALQSMLETQMKVHQWGVRVELISKIADAAVSTARRLQGGQ